METEKRTGLFFLFLSINELNKQNFSNPVLPFVNLNACGSGHYARWCLRESVGFGLPSSQQPGLA
jgi:hypothetical protein